MAGNSQSMGLPVNSTPAPDDSQGIGSRGALLDELSALLNRYSMENGSNTPDFLLAGFLMGCLENWNEYVKAREIWYGRVPTAASAAAVRSLESLEAPDPGAQGGQINAG